MNTETDKNHAVAPSGLTDVLAAAQFERDCYKAALEEIWTTYINAGIYPISSGTLAYIAKDALAANASYTELLLHNTEQKSTTEGIK